MSEKPGEKEDTSSEKEKDTLPEENLGLYTLICNSIHLLEAKNDICVTINTPKISTWYLEKIGIPVTIQAWNEIERTIIFRIQELKPLLNSKNKRIIMRLIGPCEEWFAMKAYKMLYPHADIVQFVGDAVIEI